MSAEFHASQFAVEGVRFYMQDHLMMIEVENKHATALITTHGASVLSYVPKQGVSKDIDLLWVSPTSVYDGSKPVRGGIPVCWPWFGPSHQAGLPAHGFVRNRVWHLHDVACLGNGDTVIELRIASDETSLDLWPHAFQLALKVTVSDTLQVELITTNVNDHDIEITEALHTYFTVSESQGLKVDGLDGSECLDKLTHEPGVIQTKALLLKPPIDSVFANQTQPVTIEDIGYGRHILIEADNSHSTVVWNPGPEIIKGFADMPDEAWPNMVCVESGNVLDDVVIIPSEHSHTLKMTLSAI